MKSSWFSLSKGETSPRLKTKNSISFLIIIIFKLLLYSNTLLLILDEWISNFLVSGPFYILNTLTKLSCNVEYKTVSMNFKYSINIKIHPSILYLERILYAIL